jgi:hypothetical protein
VTVCICGTTSSRKVPHRSIVERHPVGYPPQTYPLDNTPPAMQTNERLQCVATQNYGSDKLYARNNGQKSYDCQNFLAVALIPSCRLRVHQLRGATLRFRSLKSSGTRSLSHIRSVLSAITLGAGQGINYTLYSSA